MCFVLKLQYMCMLISRNRVSRLQRLENVQKQSLQKQRLRQKINTSDLRKTFQEVYEARKSRGKSLAKMQFLRASSFRLPQKSSVSSMRTSEFYEKLWSVNSSLDLSLHQARGPVFRSHTSTGLQLQSAQREDRCDLPAVLGEPAPIS